MPLVPYAPSASLDILHQRDVGRQRAHTQDAEDSTADGDASLVDHSRPLAWAVHLVQWARSSAGKSKMDKILWLVEEVEEAGQEVLRNVSWRREFIYTEVN